MPHKPGFEIRHFLIFLATGGFAAMVNIGSRLIMSQFIPFYVAVLLAYLVGMATAFILFRVFVFKSSDASLKHQIIVFTVVNIIALVQVWVVSVGLNSVVLPACGWTFYPELTAHAVGVASPTFTSYFGHKYFSFKNVGNTTAR